MNRAVSIWKKMFFENNIGRIRRTIMEYLEEEGIDTSFQGGTIMVTIDDCHYRIDFDLDNEYPKCDLFFILDGKEYESLDLTQKTFIADKVNTDKERHSIVKAFNDEIIIDTHFYSSSKQMLLDLFYEYFIDLRGTIDEMAELLNIKIEEKKQEHRPIGFARKSTPEKGKTNMKVTACNEQNVK